MTRFVETLKRKGHAEEDQYFARRDALLLAARQRTGAIRDGLGQERCVVSGGQTGVDRAALDAAQALGLATAGWCPRGRGAEDGVVPDRFPMRETPGQDPRERTEWNVRDSDATLILHRGWCQGGTRLTAELARRLGRPLLSRDLSAPLDAAEIAGWLVANRVRVLNCAGPRESESPGIQSQARVVLEAILRAWNAAEHCPRASDPAPFSDPGPSSPGP